MCFPIHKGYYGSLHITKEYQSLNGSDCINAKPPNTRNALGLISLYTRPDEFCNPLLLYHKLFSLSR